MDNQQLYYTYISFNCKGKYYIGYTKKAIKSGYKGSYTDMEFEPTHRLDLYVGNRLMAMWHEHMYHRAWNVASSEAFANKALANIWSSKGFSLTKFSKEHKEALSKALLNSDKLKQSRQDDTYRAKMSEALLNSDKLKQSRQDDTYRAKMSATKTKQYIEDASICKKISQSRKTSKNVKAIMQSEAYSKTMSEAIKNSEKHIAVVKSEKFRMSCSKAATKWHTNNKELSKATRKLSNIKLKINNRLKHLLGLKQFSSLLPLTDKDIINEVQRLEREFVGYKLLVAEIRNNSLS